MNIFARTKHIDRHIAAYLRDQAKRQLARNKKIGWDDPCGDIVRTRNLASMFSPQHASTKAIWDAIYQGDTAWRDQVPMFVRDVLDTDSITQEP
jgi:hypothetical protein